MKISICSRKLKDGRESLYLNFSDKGQRRRKTLGIVLERPVDAVSRQINREKWQQAVRIRARYELADIASVYELPNLKRPSIFLRDAFARYRQDYTLRDVATVRALHLHLDAFLRGNEPYLHEVDANFCLRFWAYLQKRLRGSTPANYFKKFRSFLAMCRRDGLLRENPAEIVRAVTDETLGKAILTFEELERLAATPCRIPEVKRAFLFACNTGLRWCDVSRLQMTDIDLLHAEMTLTQQKVAGHSSRARLHVGLNRNALHLIAGRSNGKTSGNVFDLPTYNYVSRVLERWVRSAGIDKHITFHCARHTFITNLITQGTHLSVAASLAGHSSTRHTEKYIHIADRYRREAVNRLPLLSLAPLPADDGASSL